MTNKSIFILVKPMLTFPTTGELRLRVSLKTAGFHSYLVLLDETPI